MSFALKTLRHAAAVMLSAVAFGPHLAVTHALAQDTAMIDSLGVDQQDGRFVRLGIGKTAVIKLPANVKDVIIGNDTVADVILRNQDMAYLFARAAGQTNLFFFDSDGREILHVELEVTLDTRGLKKLLERSLPGNRIEIDSTGANVVLKGMVATAEEAKSAVDLTNRFLAPSGGGIVDGISPVVVNMLKVAQGDQVALKVRVVELKRTLLKQLGVNVEAKLGTTFDSLPISGAAFGRVTEANLRIAGGANSIDMTIKALEQQGLATTLAEPTLTAISGAPASFLAGGEFPYRSCPSGTISATCTVLFRPYGVTLGFTPTVLTEGRIALNITTEVSELGSVTDGVPAIDTRRAQTSVEIPSGGSMMLAGLIKNVSNQTLRGTPGLRTLPVLGALFSSRDYQTNETELVVIVTPYIVDAVRPDQLATPTDNFSPPTDLQQIFLGRLNRVYGAPGGRPAGVYHGQVGHIVE